MCDSAELRITQPRNGAVVVEVLGEHDLSTRDSTADLFGRLVAQHDLVVIDLSRADFVDSSFLHNLVKAQTAARERGSTVRLQMGTTPIVQRLLEVSHFVTNFDHAPTRAEALADGNGPG